MDPKLAQIIWNILSGVLCIFLGYYGISPSRIRRDIEGRYDDNERLDKRFHTKFFSGGFKRPKPIPNGAIYFSQAIAIIFFLLGIFSLPFAIFDLISYYR